MRYNGYVIPAAAIGLGTREDERARARARPQRTGGDDRVIPLSRVDDRDELPITLAIVNRSFVTAFGHTTIANYTANSSVHQSKKIKRVSFTDLGKGIAARRTSCISLE